jgi:hypothetical protein
VANVKGSALSSRVLWVQLGHGAAGMDRVLAQCSPELRAFLEAGIEKAKWYPFEQFVELNVVIDRLFYKVGTAHWILGRAVRLWSAHYDSGTLEVLTRGPRTAVLRLRGFATPHPAHCLSVMGWAQRSIELSGGNNVAVSEPLCRTRGDEICQLEAKWD